MLSHLVIRRNPEGIMLVGQQAGCPVIEPIRYLVVASREAPRENRPSANLSEHLHSDSTSVRQAAGNLNLIMP